MSIALGNETVVDHAGCGDAHHHELAFAADELATIAPAESGAVRVGGVALTATNMRAVSTTAADNEGTCGEDSGFGPNMTGLATRD